GERDVDGGRADAEIGQIIFKDVERALGNTSRQVGSVHRRDEDMEATSTIWEHIERENEGVEVVAKVAGIIGIEIIRETAGDVLGCTNKVEVPVRRRKRGRRRRLGYGDHESADMR